MWDAWVHLSSSGLSSKRSTFTFPWYIFLASYRAQRSLQLFSSFPPFNRVYCYVIRFTIQLIATGIRNGPITHSTPLMSKPESYVKWIVNKQLYTTLQKRALLQTIKPSSSHLLQKHASANKPYTMQRGAWGYRGKASSFQEASSSGSVCSVAWTKERFLTLDT
jgi:hypothetical protein